MCIRDRRLRLGGRGGHAAPDVAPQVRLPGRADGQAVKRLKPRRRRGCAGRRARLSARFGDRGRAGHSGVEPGAHDLHRRDGLAVLGFGLQHVLVVDGHLLFERVQIRIVIDLPPLAFELAVVGLRLLPALRFLEVRRRLLLERRRHNRGGLPVLGSGRTSGQRQHAGQRRHNRWLPALHSVSFKPPIRSLGPRAREPGSTSAANGRSRDRPPA